MTSLIFWLLQTSIIYYSLCSGQSILFSLVINHLASGQLSTTNFDVLYKKLHPSKPELLSSYSVRGVKSPQGSSSVLQDESMCPCWPCLRQAAVPSEKSSQIKLAERAWLATLSPLSLELEWWPWAWAAAEEGEGLKWHSPVDTAVLCDS